VTEEALRTGAPVERLALMMRDIGEACSTEGLRDRVLYVDSRLRLRPRPGREIEREGVLAASEPASMDADR
jgi:hypothetical protein